MSAPCPRSSLAITVPPPSGRGIASRSALWPLVLAALFLLTTPGFATAQSTTVRGIELADTVSAGDTTLTLAGAGVRSRFFFKLYVGALYLAEPADSASTIVAADEPMMITIDILSDKVTRERLIDTLDEGFAKSTGGDTAPVQAGIDTLFDLMHGKVVPGDRLGLSYDPADGTHVSKNGEELAVIEGLPFKQALFGIWLGDEPAQGSLKSDMLGSQSP